MGLKRLLPWEAETLRELHLVYMASVADDQKRKQSSAPKPAGDGAKKPKRKLPGKR